MIGIRSIPAPWLLLRHELSVAYMSANNMMWPAATSQQAIQHETRLAASQIFLVACSFTAASSVVHYDGNDRRSPATSVLNEGCIKHNKKTRGATIIPYTSGAHDLSRMRFDLVAADQCPVLGARQCSHPSQPNVRSTWPSNFCAVSHAARDPYQ